MDINKMIDGPRDKSVHHKAEKTSQFYIVSKIMINILLILLGTVLIGMFLRSVQAQTALQKQQKNNELALSEVATILDKNAENTRTLTEIYHYGNRKTLDDIEMLLSKGLYEKLEQSDARIRNEILTELSTEAGIPYLYILDEEGKIVMCADDALIGTNPAASTHMTQENLNQIMEIINYDVMEGGQVIVPVRNQHGSYYFYSKQYQQSDSNYVLALGVSSDTLDERINSLKDVSTVLSRMSVINEGFLFAVSQPGGLFLYFNNGEEMLTGQAAVNSGLTREAMTDGYKGIQTILGEKYYCSAKAFDDNTVVVAAAKHEIMVSHDKYVLLWSVMGFALVMILCLAYALIVRNDFIRKGTETKVSILFKNSLNPYFFNRSVFHKVIPLMLIGIIVVFGVSFYTQTLLEIEEGIDKSKVILTEVIARYEESLDSKEIIEDYYNSRFLTTAKLIKFIVEENPETLNEKSDYYHSFYDEDHNRQFIMDDEGNPLKSIGRSAFLQSLCNDNRIDAIYVFDEDGRTIATNTDNWFFTLSNDPNDQSYPFRQVLEGRADSYLQPVMTNDLGEETQFFGVKLHYFTTTDKAGNTVYVSRYDFEKAADKEKTSGLTAGGITKHTSLLQIELDEELAGTMMASISADYVLSTKMLDGGAIIMFDNSKDHVCVYSPSKASIGRTAADLGVSSKAFTGEVYYGFNRINGVTYFQLYRFLNDYFIATAIPKSSMYASRFIISTITAGICMVLITILLLTVTVTNKEEEMAYENMTADQIESGLNSTIFNIILPSGRFATTTKAMVRWDNRHIPWNERSPEMKLGYILGWIAAIPITYFVLSAIGINRISEEDSVIRYILSGGWDREPNVFALSASIMTLAVTIITIELLKIPARLFTALLGTRGETVAHLLLSIFKYGGTLGALFYCLYLFGIDSGNLLASAGIISIVIGLGAQSLIKDILAGIFIVFEGEFRVGDIVTINGFRGTVTDIGLRTTKIVGGGNVKIFNNSDISGVLNMTKETSVASVAITIDYKQDYSYVEKILARELPHMKEENENILDGPTSLGITALGNDNYTITITARCIEKNVGGVNRYLNQKLLEILFKNGIKGPLPNNMYLLPDDEDEKKLSDDVKRKWEAE